MHVNGSGRLVQGIDHDEAGGHTFRGQQNSLQGIGQQSSAVTAALHALVQGEPCEQ